MNLYNRSFAEPLTTLIDHRSASLATTPIHHLCSFVGANFANISNNICNVWSHLSAKYSCMDILSVCRYLVMLRKNGFVMVRNENWILGIPILFFTSYTWTIGQVFKVDRFRNYLSLPEPVFHMPHIK